MATDSTPGPVPGSGSDRPAEPPPEPAADRPAETQADPTAPEPPAEPAAEPAAETVHLPSDGPAGQAADEAPGAATAAGEPAEPADMAAGTADVPAEGVTRTETLPGAVGPEADADAMTETLPGSAGATGGDAVTATLSAAGAGAEKAEGGEQDVPAGGYDTARDAGGTPPPPPPPPGAGPPPGGGGFPPPPPGGPQPGGLGARHRLIRPREDRKLAGVCAAIGQATGTDPVLWRVLLAVLAFIGGIGLLAYLIGWLAIPQEGDEVSPVEAAIGRGRSSTPPALTVLLGVAAAILVVVVLASGFRIGLVAAAAVIGVVLLISRKSTARRQPAGAPQQGAPAGWHAPPPGVAGDQRVAPPMGWTVPPTGASNPTYRAPFSPHGPYQPTGTPAGRTGEFRLAGDPTGGGVAAGWPTGPAAPPPPPVPPPAPRPPKPRSPLGRITFFVLLLSLGGLAVLAVTGVPVPPSAYPALGLAVVGVGLLVGAFAGRGRWLIAIGCVLALSLPVAVVGQHHTSAHGFASYGRGDRDWAQDYHPATLAELRPDYRNKVGDMTLDLTAVPFAGQDRSVEVTSDVGNVTVIVGPTVDTTVRLESGMGNATVFGQTVNGGPNPQQPRHQTFNDLGTDGAGGGSLKLTVWSRLGTVEVRR